MLVPNDLKQVRTEGTPPQMVSLLSGTFFAGLRERVLCARDPQMENVTKPLTMAVRSQGHSGNYDTLDPRTGHTPK